MSKNLNKRNLPSCCTATKSRANTLKFISMSAAAISNRCIYFGFKLNVSVLFIRVNSIRKILRKRNLFFPMNLLKIQRKFHFNRLHHGIFVDWLCSCKHPFFFANSIDNFLICPSDSCLSLIEINKFKQIQLEWASLYDLSFCFNMVESDESFCQWKKWNSLGTRVASLKFADWFHELRQKHWIEVAIYSFQVNLLVDSP